MDEKLEDLLKQREELDRKIRNVKAWDSKPFYQGALSEIHLMLRSTDPCVREYGLSRYHVMAKCPDLAKIWDKLCEL